MSDIMAQKMANSKKGNEISFEENYGKQLNSFEVKSSSKHRYIAWVLMFLKLRTERYNIRRNEDPKSDTYSKPEKDLKYLLNDKHQYTRKNIFYSKKWTRILLLTCYITMNSYIVIIRSTSLKKLAAIWMNAIN
jgi:hypothetical protein